MNHTANYQLSQWVKSDQVKMEDFNADNAKIDAALKAASDARTAMQTALNQKGNCSIGTFTYQGNGTYGSSNPTRVTFPRRPTMFMILGHGTLMGLGSSSQATTMFADGYVHVETCSVSWSGSTLSFYSIKDAQIQLNLDNQTYLVVYFCAES